MTRTVHDHVPAVVRETLETANAHDISRFLDCFVADGAVDDWGRVFTGRQQIRRWSDADRPGFLSLRSRAAWCSPAPSGSRVPPEGWMCAIDVRRYGHRTRSV